MSPDRARYHNYIRLAHEAESSGQLPKAIEYIRTAEMCTDDQDESDELRKWRIRLEAKRFEGGRRT